VHTGLGYSRWITDQYHRCIYVISNSAVESEGEKVVVAPGIEI